jgi:hypothetical protein
MNEPEFDPRLIAWLRAGPSGAPERVLEAVVAHAHANRRRSMRTPWRDVMKTMTSGHVAAPAFRLVLVVGVTTITVALAGLFYAGWQGLPVGPAVTPSPTPVESATPSPTPGESATPAPTPGESAKPAPSRPLVDPAGVIRDTLIAWREGNVAAADDLFASDHAILAMGNPGPLEPMHFAIRPGHRGYAGYWERAGDDFHEGAFWAHGMVAGIFDPGSHGFVVYRFDEQNRIEVEWVVAWGTAWTTWHHSVTAEIAPADVVAFLDRCSAALDAGDEQTYLDCHAPEASVLISADGVRGAWTEEYWGSAAVRTWLDASSAYGRITRSGDVMMIGDLVAYPFRASSSDTCRDGIDVIRLDSAHARIRSHWAFFGD